MKVSLGGDEMIKAMNRNVEDVSNHHAPMPNGGKNPPIGVMLLLSGDKHYRWVPYNAISWESV